MSRIFILETADLKNQLRWTVNSSALKEYVNESVTYDAVSSLEKYVRSMTAYLDFKNKILLKCHRIEFQNTFEKRTLPYFVRQLTVQVYGKVWSQVEIMFIFYIFERLL